MNPGAPRRQPLLELAPYQKALVDTVLEGHRRVLLRAPVGLGKTRTFAAVAARLLEQKPASRVLFLVPGPLQSQAVEMLRDGGISSVSVDRYRFREMLDSQGSEDVWPAGNAFVLGRDFARRPDISDSLAAVHWDLLVVDEAQAMRGGRAEALGRIVAAAERVLLAMPRAGDLQDSLTVDDFFEVEWRLEDFLGNDVEPTIRRARKVLPMLMHQVHYGLTAEELSLRATVIELARLLQAIPGLGAMRAGSLMRCLDSSPAALEATLRRLASGTALALAGEVEAGGARDDESDRAASTPSGSCLADATVANASQSAIEELDILPDDSKLREFGALLSRLGDADSGRPANRVCVLADFTSTLYYLATAIEERGMVCRLVPASMPPEDRQKAYARFSDEGGVLVVSRAALSEWVEMFWNASNLVLYDWDGDGPALIDTLRGFVCLDGIGLNPLELHCMVLSPECDSPVTQSLVTQRVQLDDLADSRNS